MTKWSKSLAPQLQVELNSNQLTEGIAGWLADKRQNEINDKAVIFSHCIKHLIYARRVHPNNSKEQLFTIINRYCGRNIEKIASEYTRGNELATPEMTKLYLEWELWNATKTN